MADGGEVVLYAPHIGEIAAMHPDQGVSATTAATTSWPTGSATGTTRGELAHSTHLFGAGTYDPVHGERQRVRVTLATGIPEDVVVRANLGYLDPASVDVARWRADPGALVVPRTPARPSTGSGSPSVPRSVTRRETPIRSGP